MLIRSDGLPSSPCVRRSPGSSGSPLRSGMPTAIVTRATAGLGPALTLALAERGWRLVLGCHEPRALEAQAAGLATATEVAVFPGDVCHADYRAMLVATAGPRLDLLVNNAVPPARDVLATVDGHPLDALEDVYRDSVLAPLALVQLALPSLVAGGRIVNVIPGLPEARNPGDVRASAGAALEHLTDAITAANPELRIQAVSPARAKSNADAVKQIVDLV